jgi:hypothetical protein
MREKFGRRAIQTDKTENNTLLKIQMWRKQGNLLKHNLFMCECVWNNYGVKGAKAR